MDRIRFSDRNLLFVLGVERSGSTWLSNMFDASPEVESFMEPFGETPHLFRGFPDRLTYLHESDALLEERVRETLAGLRQYKYYGFESPNSPSLVRRLNWKVQALLEEITGAAGIAQIPARTRYRQLNLNRIGNPETVEFDKSSDPDAIVFKELRLNFKIRFLRDLFPEARYVVIIRNPLSQVDSIMRLLERGSLSELAGVLDSFVESIRGQERFSEYGSIIRELGEDRTSRAVAYWFANYATLVEDLEATDARYRLVRHEDLCERPTATLRDLFSSVGLTWHRQVDRYVEQSSTSDHDGNRPTETRRHSRSYYRRALQRVDRARRNRFWRLAEPWWSEIPDGVAAYRSWLEERAPAGGDGPR